MMGGRKTPPFAAATALLRQWMLDHFENPYPSEEVKEELCAATGLSLTQLNNWFINIRGEKSSVESVLHV